MAYKRYDAEKTVTGPARIAVNSAVLGTDPATVAAIMDSATYDFVGANGWVDLGPTNGGVTLAKGYATQSYDHDLGTQIKLEVTGNTMSVSTQLAESGLLSRFDYSWLTQTGTTAIGDGVKKGLAAVKVLVHRSVAVSELDGDGRIRLFYLRDAVPGGGDVNYAIQPNTAHNLPINLTAFQDTTKTDNEFGWIYEATNFGT